MTVIQSGDAAAKRIWVDGCFDFFHHGHAGALRQARALGDELVVGVHSDKEIEKNKGPVVMHESERVFAVTACRWTTQTVPDAPYVTDPDVMKQYACQYVAHGDDITTDANGNDCYQKVKDLGMFIVFKRAPNISTTDLIGRMLNKSRLHHIAPYNLGLQNHFLNQPDIIERFRLYATDETAKSPCLGVYIVSEDLETSCVVKPIASVENKLGRSTYYLDGDFDLFHPGHIEVLSAIHDRAQRNQAAVVVGIYDDACVNKLNGLNYPIMNIFERALCVLQCKNVDAIVLSAPLVLTDAYLASLKRNGLNVCKIFNKPQAVAKYSESLNEYSHSPVKNHDLYDVVAGEKYGVLTTSTIVERVLNQRLLYEQRQRNKGHKTDLEISLQKAQSHQTKSLRID